MNEPILAHIDINTKFFRDEQWSVLRRAFSILEKKYQKKIAESLSVLPVTEVSARISCSSFADALFAAGIVGDKKLPPPSSDNDFRPQARLAPVAEKGKYIRFNAYEDGSISHEFLEAKPT